jgi:lipooligosaccharide transport system permease protein
MTVAAGALRVLEHDLRFYRQTWRGTLTSTFVSPVLFLAALGVGLGAFIDQSGNEVLPGVSYAEFVGPALLMTQAMQAAIFECSYPLMGKFEWRKTFFGILATPVTVGGLFTGEVLWLSFRIGVGAIGFFIALVLFGLVLSPTGVIAIPVAILTGLGFALPMFAFTASITRDEPFSLIFRFIQIPLFLFSGTFFPIDELPPLLAAIAWLTPIANGIAIARDATLGTLNASAIPHLAVILAWIVVGGMIAIRQANRRLVV